VNIVTCPNCHSKFRFTKEGLEKSTFKMRCSVCAYIFTHTIELEASLEEEFNTLLTSGQDTVTPAPEQEGGDQELSQEITETSGVSPTDYSPDDSEAHPDSVMREIDSILGAGSEIAGEEDIPAPQEKPRRSLAVTMLLIMAVLAVGMASLWYFQDKIPFFERQRNKQSQAALEKGPFFSIDMNSITHELLTHENEGSVLVIRGSIKKITPKAVDSILVEARVYDRAGKQLESRMTYAGIVPETSEFTRQAGKDIDALLTSQPASSRAPIPSSDIPFAVAFFGKSAQEGTSFQVEVKEFHWR
jgi:predicted Zn finger-like uncharacterized protein